jgi:phosphoglycolate phosphatase-like HAD superfamily hydrolase
MHVCFFDIDGTLLNTGGAGQAAMERALAAEFRSDRPLNGILYAGRTDRAIVADLFAHFGVEPSEDRWTRFLTAYLRHLPENLRSRTGLVLPGIVQLLDELHRRDDVLLGLITGNFREGARIKLEHFEIDRYFTFGGYGDDHLERDEVACLALTEAERMFGKPFLRERMWVIGDTPADVKCARAIGAQAVAVATGVYARAELQAASPDHLFDDFSDPAGMLSLLTSRV